MFNEARLPKKDAIKLLRIKMNDTKRKRKASKELIEILKPKSLEDQIKQLRLDVGMLQGNKAMTVTKLEDLNLRTGLLETNKNITVDKLHSFNSRLFFVEEVTEALTHRVYLLFVVILVLSLAVSFVGYYG